MNNNLDVALENLSNEKENFDQKALECDSNKNLKDKNELQVQNQKESDALKKVEDKIHEIERRAKNDISKVEMFLKSGLLNQKQGENLIQQIINKGYQELRQCDLKTPVQQTHQQLGEKSFDKISAISEFEKENPDFFNKNGRLDVLNYLKSGVLNFDKEEVSQISKLIEMVEKSAIERYLKETEIEAKMQKTNEEAKSRLNANAQNAKDTSKQTVFTREQIGKMSGAEFTKNEKLIMEQLRQGLIR